MTVRPIADPFALAEMDALLRREGIKRDQHLDYSCGLYDEEEELLATGSCFGNTIRCLAVSGGRRGEGLLVQVMGHLMDVQARRGNLHVFLYTKPENTDFFTGLGFSTIVRGENILFMENRREGFRKYCDALKKVPGQRIAAAVMNCNPFTLGHRHLLEQAAGENDVVHLFLLSEDRGPIPFSVRKKLVQEGIADLPNVILQDWRFSAFIDFDQAGLGDRHMDLYWALWSLRYNLKTERYADRFLDRYGRENFDPKLLHAVAAFEFFGHKHKKSD